MSDVVERGRDVLRQWEIARVHGLQPDGRRSHEVIAELVAEVERLRLAADGPGRYDWMAGELVAMAGEMSGGDGVRSAQNQFVAAAFLSVAEYVSASKGSGQVSARGRV